MTLKQWIVSKNVVYPHPSFEVWTLNEFNVETYVSVRAQEINSYNLVILDYDMEDLIVEEDYFQDYDYDGDDESGRPIMRDVSYSTYKITPKVKPLRTLDDYINSLNALYKEHLKYENYFWILNRINNDPYYFPCAWEINNLSGLSFKGIHKYYSKIVHASENDITILSFKEYLEEEGITLDLNSDECQKLLEDYLVEEGYWNDNEDDFEEILEDFISRIENNYFDYKELTSSKSTKNFLKDFSAQLNFIYNVDSLSEHHVTYLIVERYIDESLKPQERIVWRKEVN